MIEYRNLKVALLGGGSVGANVASLLLEHGDELASRAGAGLELIGVAVRDLDAERSPSIPKHLLTTDAEALILGADIVIELIGGIEPAMVADVIASGAAGIAVMGGVMRAVDPAAQVSALLAALAQAKP